MAVLSHLPSVKAMIIVGDVPAPEHEDDEPTEPNITTKYIEAISDASFHVDIGFSIPFPAHHSVLVVLYLDGVCLHRRCLKDQELLGNSMFCIQGQNFWKHGKCYTQSFRFTKLIIDEDSGKPLDAQKEKALSQAGHIHVDLFFVENVETQKAKPNTTRTRLNGLNEIPEKALKKQTLSHSISLGKPRLNDRTFDHVRTFDYVDPKKVPFGTFIFKYRSRESLKSLYIIPRTPSPARREIRRDSAAKNEEMCPISDRRCGESAPMKEECEAKKGLKGSQLDDGDDDDVLVISAKSCRKKRAIPNEDDEVIVLD